MSWIPLVIGAWLLLSVAAALVIGLSIRLADRGARASTDATDGSMEPPTPEVPAPRHPHSPTPTDGTRSSRPPVVLDCLPAAERQPAPPRPADLR